MPPHTFRLTRELSRAARTGAKWAIGSGERIGPSPRLNRCDQWILDHSSSRLKVNDLGASFSIGPRACGRFGGTPNAVQTGRKTQRLGSEPVGAEHESVGGGANRQVVGGSHALPNPFLIGREGPGGPQSRSGSPPSRANGAPSAAGGWSVTWGRRTRWPPASPVPCLLALRFDPWWAISRSCSNRCQGTSSSCSVPGCGTRCPGECGKTNGSSVPTRSSFRKTSSASYVRFRRAS